MRAPLLLTPTPPANLVRQRSTHDCLLCSFAMMADLSYEDVQNRARRIMPDYDPLTVPMTHSLMRRIADTQGLVLLSSIYMDWRYPGIVGVVSKTIENCGHALFWDGAQLIDPSVSGLYDRAYVDQAAMEFTQRAEHLAALIQLERSYKAAARAVTLAEAF